VVHVQKPKAGRRCAAKVPFGFTRMHTTHRCLKRVKRSEAVPATSAEIWLRDLRTNSGASRTSAQRGSSSVNRATTRLPAGTPRAHRSRSGDRVLGEAFVLEAEDSGVEPGCDAPVDDVLDPLEPRRPCRRATAAFFVGCSGVVLM